MNNQLEFPAGLRFMIHHLDTPGLTVPRYLAVRMENVEGHL